MEQETHYTRHHRRAVVTTTTPPPPSPTVVDAEGDRQHDDHLLTLSKPAGWLVQLVTTQAELISTTLLSLSSPLYAILSDSQATPTRVAHGGAAALRRLTFGLLGAAYACGALLAAMILAVLVGVALVRLWVEDPVSVHRPLHLDYTHAHPVAAVSLSTGGFSGRAVPAGHAVRVSLLLLMPESDYNRQIGVFQVTTEAISSSGNIIATSSQPCMLRFRSLPIRLVRTFVMGIPLVVGMSSESQKIVIEILRYKESNQKTKGIRVRLIPRSGTSDLPQIYAAEIIINTQLPRRKELVYNWKWTFYVWISLYVYVILLILLVCCFKPFGFPRQRSYETEQLSAEVARDGRYRGGEISNEFSDAIKRWRDRSRRKRKVLLSPPQVRFSELSDGSASSPAGGEESEVIEEYGDFAASESSECVGG